MSVITFPVLGFSLYLALLSTQIVISEVKLRSSVYRSCKDIAGIWCRHCSTWLLTVGQKTGWGERGNPSAPKSPLGMEDI